MNYNKETLARSLHTKWAGQAIHFYEKIDSTNAEAVRLGKEAIHGILIVAKQQTAGRGRRGRVWESHEEANVYFSLLLKPEISAEKASMLTLVMAVSVMEGVHGCVCASGESENAGNLPTGDARSWELQQDELQLGIKWPNDIVLGGKKVCGILTEAVLSGTTLEQVVIGVGINVGKQSFSDELVDKATTLEQECGYIPDRSVLIGKVMEAFEGYYEQFLQVGSLDCILEQYNACLLNRDRQVRVLDPQGEFTGVARGINNVGELLVECADGSVTAVYAGEVSVRGIYGYV